jgi:hypothetical protein
MSSLAQGLFGLNIVQAFCSALLVRASWGCQMRQLLARVGLLALCSFGVLYIAWPSSANVTTRLVATAEYVVPYFAVLLLYCFVAYRPDRSSPLRAEIACVLIGVALIPMSFMLTFDAPCRISGDCAL